MIGRRVTNRTTLFRCGIASAISLVVALASCVAAHADAPRALPAGELPADTRLGPLKDLNGYFPFVVPKSKADWEQRQTELKQRVQDSPHLAHVVVESAAPSNGVELIQQINA